MSFFPSLIIAFSTYSRLPMPRTEWTEENRRLTFCFFPLVGVPIGAAAILWQYLCLRLSVGPVLRGAVATALPLLLTGGIHMDGFMDTCDALASWQPREKRLQILKDSHVGSFAVLGCTLYLLVMTGLLAECSLRDSFSLAVIYVLSRALSACLSVFLPQARKDGMLSSLATGAAGNALRLS
ncbi:MAG: adenosylcobinamide-GDP ribazoletransferase, partial [Clostridia bacterium]|nr:adenosylcobinamide-GDP ribazoletransferase [Clostridia bacterium]